MKMSVIIPAFNESACLRQCLLETHDCLSRQGWEFEIVVVDDGSTDGTLAIAREVQKIRSGIRCHRHAVNTGLGVALRTGFSQASGEWLFFIPADGQFDINQIDRFLPWLDSSDVIAGVKSGISDYSAYRRMNSRLFVAFYRLLFGLRLEDYNYVQMYRAQVIRSLDLSARGIFITGEILAKAARRGCRIRAVEATYLPRRGGQATGVRLSNALKTVCEMIRIRWEMGDWPSPAAPGREGHHAQ